MANFKVSNHIGASGELRASDWIFMPVFGIVHPTNCSKCHAYITHVAFAQHHPSEISQAFLEGFQSGIQLQMGGNAPISTHHCEESDKGSKRHRRPQKEDAAKNLNDVPASVGLGASSTASLNVNNGFGANGDLRTLGWILLPVFGIVHLTNCSTCHDYVTHVAFARHLANSPSFKNALNDSEHSQPFLEGFRTGFKLWQKSDVPVSNHHREESDNGSKSLGQPQNEDATNLNGVPATVGRGVEPNKYSKSAENSGKTEDVTKDGVPAPPGRYDKQDNGSNSTEKPSKTAEDAVAVHNGHHEPGDKEPGDEEPDDEEPDDEEFGDEELDDDSNSLRPPKDLGVRNVW